MRIKSAEGYKPPAKPGESRFKAAQKRHFSLLEQASTSVSRAFQRSAEADGDDIGITDLII